MHSTKKSFAKPDFWSLWNLSHLCLLASSLPLHCVCRCITTTCRSVEQCRINRQECASRHLRVFASKPTKRGVKIFPSSGQKLLKVPLTTGSQYNIIKQPLWIKMHIVHQIWSLTTWLAHNGLFFFLDKIKYFITLPAHLTSLSLDYLRKPPWAEGKNIRTHNEKTSTSCQVPVSGC